VGPESLSERRKPFAVCALRCFERKKKKRSGGRGETRGAAEKPFIIFRKSLGDAATEEWKIGIWEGTSFLSAGMKRPKATTIAGGEELWGKVTQGGGERGAALVVLWARNAELQGKKNARTGGEELGVSI